MQVGTKTLNQEIKDLNQKLKDMTESNKNLERQYLEARSQMQQSDTVIARLKLESQQTMER